MSEETMRKLFARNLRRLLALKGKQPADIVKDLGIPFSTVSNWINGDKYPRMGKIELLADYFGVQKSDLMEDKGDSIPESYYLNDEARELAEFLYKYPDYKVLFDASRKVKPEDIEFVRQMIDRMGGKNES